MPKKVFEIAKQVGMRPLDLVEHLRGKGFAVRNHMQSLKDEEVKKILASFEPQEAPGKKKTKAKKASSSKKKATKKVVKKKVVKKKATAKKAEEPKKEEAQKKEAQAPKDAEKKKKKKTVIRRKKGKTAGGLQIPEEEGGKAPAEEQKRGLRVISRPELPEAKKEAPETGVVVPPTTAQSSATTEKGVGKRKRLGGLASMMSGKKSMSRAETIAQQKSESELKSYSGLGGVGRPLYTQIKRKKVYIGPVKDTEITEIKKAKRIIRLHGGATAAQIAKKLKVKFKEMADRCLDLDLLVQQDDFIGIKLAQKIGEFYEYKIDNVAFDESEHLEIKEETEKKNLSPRNPVLTIMGHVDHGKTTLLDTMRQSKVASEEAGGITQHIGAYEVCLKDKAFTFLDTPGHEAFASMRQRGADVTDIVILVVAADDGVMPQTKESIHFCRNAGKPIIVAVNKMDKEGANPDRVKTELAEQGLTPEEWGGDTQFVAISALKGEGIDALLEAVSLQAEMMELSAEAQGLAEGVIIESKMEQGRGIVATALILNGVLKKGDALVAGECFGRARNFVNFRGEEQTAAGPSTPVQILGINPIPGPGDRLNVVKNERTAKRIVQNRINERKKLESRPLPKMSLEDFFAGQEHLAQEEVSLNLIVRSDVQGSFETIKESLISLSTKRIKVKLIGGGIGPITDTDVQLAASSNGLIIGFNMRPTTSARRLSEERGVDIKTYSIIYELIHAVKAAVEGLLEPESYEEYIGRADIKETFSVPKVGVIAGTLVVDGKIIVGQNMRVLRAGKIIHDGKISSLRRFKDDVKEVNNNLECGIGIENFNDLKVGDTLECYALKEKKRKYDDVVKDEQAVVSEEPPKTEQTADA